SGLPVARSQTVTPHPTAISILPSGEQISIPQPPSSQGNRRRSPPADKNTSSTPCASTPRYSDWPSGENANPSHSGETGAKQSSGSPVSASHSRIERVIRERDSSALQTASRASPPGENW